MSELKACPCCKSMAAEHTLPKIGIPSGDEGFQCTIMCTGRECGVKVEKWALKKEGAEKSAMDAWNRRAEPNEALTVDVAQMVQKICDKHGYAGWLYV